MKVKFLYDARIRRNGVLKEDDRRKKQVYFGAGCVGSAMQVKQLVTKADKKKKKIYSLQMYITPYLTLP